jgi:hypothetical protein
MTKSREAPTVRLPPLAPPVDELWHVLLDLGDSLTVPWTLVGGQMVILHALEHGVAPVRPTQDGDVVADVRADRRALRAVVEALTGAGFELAGITPDGVGHRYSRPLADRESEPPTTASPAPRQVVIDVLAPEGLGSRADLTTTPPGRTIAMPAGRQALTRTRWVNLEHEGRTGRLPCPDLHGALVAKAAACGLGGDVSRHLDDVALLCALVGDPFGLAGELTPKDRKRLRMAARLSEADHRSWFLLSRELAARGQVTYEVLAGG